jgi:hypothetical protein
MKNSPMKTVVVYGGLMLALYTFSRLLGRNRGVPADSTAVLQPRIPPCLCTYKEFTFSLN